MLLVVTTCIQSHDAHCSPAEHSGLTKEYLTWIPSVLWECGSSGRGQAITCQAYGSHTNTLPVLTCTLIPGCARVSPLNLWLSGFCTGRPAGACPPPLASDLVRNGVVMVRTGSDTRGSSASADNP